MDAFLLIGGFMLGGTVGVGTIIAMATTGPFIQLCLPYGQKFTDFILINKDESQGVVNEYFLVIKIEISYYYS